LVVGFLVFFFLILLLSSISVSGSEREITL
jgi:hypothetical protein